MTARYYIIALAAHDGSPDLDGETDTLPDGIWATYSYVDVVRLLPGRTHDDYDAFLEVAWWGRYSCPHNTYHGWATC